MRNTFAILGAIAVTLALMICIASMIGCSNQPEPISPVDPDVVEPTSTPVIGKLAPQIDASDFAGRNFKLIEQRGRVVVISFWASWCQPCRALIPHEIALVAKHADDQFTLIGVAVDEEPDKALAAIMRARILYRNLPDAPTHAISDTYVVKALPTTFVIDKTGVLRAKFVGAHPHDVDAAVTALLQSK